MKKHMKITLVSALGLAIALPACAQNAAQSDRIVGSAGTATSQSASAAGGAMSSSFGAQATRTSVSTQGSMLIGSLGATTTTASVAALVIVSGAEAVSSTGHTK